MRPFPVPSLRGIVAGSMPFQQLLNTCNDPSFVDSNICLWETWRERAYLEFGVPYEYFDLTQAASIPETPYGPEVPARNISGSFRYLEIATKFKLLPQSAVSLNKRTATVSGIYEAYSGIREAVERNDIDGINIFFPRLRREQKEEIKRQIQEHEIAYLSPFRFAFAAFGHLTRLLFGPEAEQILTEGRIIEYSEYSDFRHVHQPPEWQLEVERLEKNKADDGTQLVIGTDSFDTKFWEGLRYLISQGCRFALIQALALPSRRLFATFDQRPIYDTELQVSEDRRAFVIFQAVLKSGQIDMLNRVLYLRENLQLPTIGDSVEEILALGQNPNSTHKRSYVSDEYFESACYSGNPLFLDFLLALHRYPLYRPNCEYISQGWYTRRNPVGYYQILQKCDLSEARREILKLGDIDMILYITAAINPQVRRDESEVDILSRNESNIDMILYITATINPRVEWGEDEDGNEFEIDVLSRNEGNIDILLTYLPLYQRAGDAASLLARIDPSIYPLSALLIKGAYQNN